MPEVGQVDSPAGLTSVDEARRTLLAQTRNDGARYDGTREERVGLLEASGRVSSRPVFAAGAAPPFDRSPYDGYTFRVADLARCRRGLVVSGKVAAGGAPGSGPGPGQAWRVATGAPLPPGCDAVVRFEDTELRGNVVHVKVPVRPGENVVRRGEDFAAGDLLLPAGTVIEARHVGLLAAGGHAAVWVARKPRVALLSTGDELVETGHPLGPGQIWNSNVYALAAAVGEAGGQPIILGTCPDSVAAIAEALRSALAGGAARRDPDAVVPDGEGAPAPDLILTTGGASVGERDVCRAAVAELGGKELFWRTAMKPGTPAFAALLANRLLIGLSGNPAAALTTFDVLVRPVIAALLGLDWRPAVIRAELVNRTGKPSSLRRYYRALLTCEGGRWTADVLPGQSPGVLSGIAQANGLVVVPEGKGPLEPGEQVEAWLMTGGVKPLSPAPPILSIVGKSDTGKTTLITRLIIELGRRGYRVGTIKHDVHGFELDVPGKDTWRHARAGARAVAISSPGKLALIQVVDRERTIDEVADMMDGVDLIMAEGYKSADKPKIEVTNKKAQGELICTVRDGLMAVAAEEPALLTTKTAVPPAVPVFHRDDAPGLCDFIEATFLKPAAPRGGGSR